MVNSKKNPLMGLEVTEGSQKKAKMDRTALTASPAAVARRRRLRKAFPDDGCGGDAAEEPMVRQTESPVPPRDYAEDGFSPSLPFCPAASPGARLLHTRYA